MTSDSFSDAGRFVAVEAALAHAHQLAMHAIMDVGARVTRPRVAPVAEAEELAQIEPILAELARTLDVRVSVDASGLPLETGHE